MKLDPDRVPDNLTMAIAIFIAGLSDEEDRAFRVMKENELVHLDSCIGATLRNDWSLWRLDTRLMIYFSTLQIAQPAEVSALIIRAAWRVLNKQPLEEELLLHQYQNSGSPIDTTM